MMSLANAFPDDPRGRRRMLVVVALAAVVFRLAYLVEIHDHPYWRTPLVDAADFHARAMDVAAGRGLGADVYYKAPTYAWLVGQLYRLTGPHLEATYALQMLLGVGTAVLTALLGWTWLGPWAAWAGGLCTALYAPGPYYENQVLIETSALFVSVVAVWFLFGALRRTGAEPLAEKPAWRLTADLLGGLATGLAVQLRPVNLALLVALGLALCLSRAPAALRFRRLVCLLVPVCLVLVPTLRHNRIATGKIVPISVNGGINFYIGNNPDYDTTVGIRPGLRWDELTERFDAMENPVRWQENFYRASFEWMRAHPGAWLALTGKKLLLFWNRIEIDRNQDSSAMRGDSIVLRFGVPWGLFAPWGLLGLAVLWRQWRRLPLHALCGVQMLGVIAFFVTSRYRLAVVPWLALAAGPALRELVHAIRKRDRRCAAVLGAGLVAAAALVLPQWPGLGNLDFGRPDFDRAEVLARRGDRDGALAAYERAAARHPNDPDVRFRYGEHLLRMGQKEAALAEYRTASGLAPWSYKPPLALGAALIESGELDAAWGALEEAERRGDRHGTTLYDMAVIRERQGRIPEALRLYRRSLERPDRSSEIARRRLGVARTLVRMGQPEAAEVEFRAAIRAGADSAQVASERARVLERARGRAANPPTSAVGLEADSISTRP